MSSNQPQQQSKTRPTALSHDGTSRSSSSRSDTIRSQPPNQPPIPSIESPIVSAPAWPNVAQPPPSPLPPRFRIPESPRSASDEKQNKAAKIAIPRLKRTADEAATRQGGRHRVTHACEPCRHRKTKCSGERPICRHCQDFKIACYFADGKRDRVKKQFGSMSERVADYETLLKELMSRVSEADGKLIRIALEKDSGSDSLEAVSKDSIEQPPDAEDVESGDESEVSAGAGSTGALDRTNEDFTREDAQSTGFMGKNSEITWMQRLRQENRSRDGQDKQSPNASHQRSGQGSSQASGQNAAPTDGVHIGEDHGLTARDNSYHLDDLSVMTYDAVDPYEVPTPDMAQHLFDAYLRTVHTSFPIIGRVNLVAQFQKFVTGQVQRPPEKWLAIINIIFAIGAKYSHFVQAEWRGDDRDHLVYFTRARLLSMNGDSLFQHPDLQQIQILGLTSFYFLCISQINRAWTFVGIAIRAATGLGMNVRNDNSQLRNGLKEIRYRAWWALYALEHRLCSMTGRVNCVIDEHCTTPLPVPIDEEHFDTEEGVRLLNSESQQGQRDPQSNSHTPSAAGSTPSTDRSRSGRQSASRSVSTSQAAESWWAKDASASPPLHFLHRVQLTRLTQNMFAKLYTPTTAGNTWSDVQRTIAELNDHLEVWHRRLPTVFDFRRNQRDRDHYEYRLSLGFCYYDAKITINRPCLCRLDRKMPNQSGKSAEFNNAAATACVEAAQEMLHLIPDEPNPVGLMRVGPWWCILHWIVQAAVVLMLEISFRVQHMPQEAQNVLDSSKKAVKWLHALGEDNMSAARAWSLCNTMLHGAASKIGGDLRDLPTRPPGRTSVSSSEGSFHPVPQLDMANISTPGMYSTSQVGQLLYPGGTGMDAFATSYDQMMQYDQYMPNFQTGGDQAQFQGNAGDQMQYTNQSFPNQQNHRHSGHQGDRSQYN